MHYSISCMSTLTMHHPKQQPNSFSIFYSFILLNQCHLPVNHPTNKTKIQNNTSSFFHSFVLLRMGALIHMRLLIFMLHFIYSPMICMYGCETMLSFSFSYSSSFSLFLSSYYHLCIAAAVCLWYLLCLYVVSKTENTFKPLNDAIDCIVCKPTRLHSLSSNDTFSVVVVVVVVCDWLDGSMDPLIDQTDIEAKELIISQTFSN